MPHDTTPNRQSVRHTIAFDADVAEGDRLQIEGDEAKHAVRVKRVREGDRVRVLLGDGRVALTHVEDAGRTLALRVAECWTEPMPFPRIEVCTATPKGPRLEKMIDMLAQVGADQWRPMSTKYGVVDPRENKLARSQRVADEAMDTIGGLLGSRVIPVAEGTRALGDAVVHAFRNAQPTHHAIATAVSLHDPAASEAGVRLGLNMSPDVMSAGTHPVFPLVQHANRNALDATASQGGGRNEVDATVVPDPDLAQGECLLIMVVDDGPGVFLGSDDPFVLGVSTKETGGGVGLTICRDIAQSLGGRVSLGSVPPARPDLGWGTTGGSALLPRAPSNHEVLIGAEGNAGGSGG